MVLLQIKSKIRIKIVSIKRTNYLFIIIIIIIIIIHWPHPNKHYNYSLLCCSVSIWGMCRIIRASNVQPQADQSKRRFFLPGFETQLSFYVPSRKIQDVIAGYYRDSLKPEKVSFVS